MSWAGALLAIICVPKSRPTILISDKSVVANKDLTISVVDDKRRIYGVEGAVDYLIPDTDWSTE